MNHLVGKLRPSQLLWSYGPGALIDLPNFSAITMGLDKWEEGSCIPIEESRLLAAVQQILGPQVTRLRVPPVVVDENADSLIGVPVKPFPRFLRCVKCGLLAEYDSDLFSIKANKFRPEYTHFVHTNCERGGSPDAVPARFLLACRNGHLDDFPWHWFVHGGPSECTGTLRFFEGGASLQTENLWVKCDACGVSKSLVHAFGREAQDNLPACRGRHPHLNTFDPSCEERPRAVLLGATNSWFPINLSVLAIPLGTSPLLQLIDDGWEDLADTESIEELKGIMKMMSKRGILPELQKYDLSEVWEAIQQKRDGGGDPQTIYEGDIKTPEWEVLTAPELPTDWPHFLGKRIDPPVAFRHIIRSVVLVERLREVNALVGYTRVEAPDESMEDDERPPMADLCRGRPEWVPASEVFGEGIFLEFDEAIVSSWESHPAVQARSSMLLRGHSAWRSSRNLDPSKGYPGIRYVMLHTISHLLIRELALECGYNSASIRERIYASTDTTAMAGILLYTAAADSDGTLGGLVELGKAENLGRLLEQALTRATVCSSDPLCSEHQPVEDRSLHVAACHACSFVSETSCERGNKYLDRALVVKTMESKDCSIFEV